MDVTIRFDATMRFSIEDRFCHHRQRLEWNEDGGVTLRMRVLTETSDAELEEEGGSFRRPVPPRPCATLVL